jgi:hypothetical protein
MSPYTVCVLLTSVSPCSAEGAISAYAAIHAAYSKNPKHLKHAYTLHLPGGVAAVVVYCVDRTRAFLPPGLESTWQARNVAAHVGSYNGRMLSTLVSHCCVTLEAAKSALAAAARTPVRDAPRARDPAGGEVGAETCALVDAQAVGDAETLAWRERVKALEERAMVAEAAAQECSTLRVQVEALDAETRALGVRVVAAEDKAKAAEAALVVCRTLIAHFHVTAEGSIRAVVARVAALEEGSVVRAPEEAVQPSARSEVKESRSTGLSAPATARWR